MFEVTLSAGGSIVGPKRGQSHLPGDTDESGQLRDTPGQ